jgi:hypothetical protein
MGSFVGRKRGDNSWTTTVVWLRFDKPPESPALMTDFGGQ